MNPATRHAIYRPDATTPVPTGEPLTDQERPSHLRKEATRTARHAGEIDLYIGDMFGKYLIGERVGVGGTAVVVRATDTEVGVPVALKFPRRSALKSDPGLLEAIGHESRLLSRVNHPNVVTVRDFDDKPGRPFIAMDFVNGLTLADLLRQAGRLQPDRVVALLSQAALGLAAAWDAGAVHRDVKPANLMVTRDGILKVTDFGLAAAVDDPSVRYVAHSGDGRLVGTPAYMAPEQATRPTEVTRLSDIYSLGATFYQMLTDRLPFPAESARQAVVRHIKDELTPPHEVCPAVPTWLSAVIVRMMDKQPQARFGCPGELLEALRGDGEEEMPDETVCEWNPAELTDLSNPELTETQKIDNPGRITGV